jgi:hypothetical protein
LPHGGFATIALSRAAFYDPNRGQVFSSILFVWGSWMGRSCCAVLAVLVSAVSQAAPLVIENASSQPFVYRFYRGFDAGGAWAAPQTLAPQERHALDAPTALVVGFQQPDAWKTYTLNPGAAFRVRTDAAGRNELFQAAASSFPGTIRPLKVMAAADLQYRARFPHWRERIAGIVARASRLMEGEFGIRIDLLRVQEWPSSSQFARTANETLASLARIDRGEAEILMGIAGAVHPLPGQPDSYAAGWTGPFSPYVLVTDDGSAAPGQSSDAWNQPEFAATATVVHELAHAFGAFHVSGTNSIMCERPTRAAPPRIEFDEVSRTLIRLTRDVDFVRGPDSLPLAARGQIRELYRQHRPPGAALINDPITLGYGWRIRLAILTGDLAQAARLSQRADAWLRDAGPNPRTAGRLSTNPIR